MEDELCFEAPQIAYVPPEVQEQSIVIPSPEYITRYYTVGSNTYLEKDIRAGVVVIARLSIYKRWGSELSFARHPFFPRDIVLKKKWLRGPAIHDDIVAIKLLPIDEWEVDDMSQNANNNSNNYFDSSSASTSMNASLSSTTSPLSMGMSSNIVYVENDNDNDDPDEVGVGADQNRNGVCDNSNSSNNKNKSNSSSQEVEHDEFAADDQEVRRDVLPDGRPIVRSIRPESITETMQRASPEVKLAYALHAPTSFHWPADRQPTGLVVCVLERKINSLQCGVITERALSTDGSMKKDYFYTFRPYNPLIPQLAVYGADIPYHFHANIKEYLFLLQMCCDGHGNLIRVLRDCVRCTIRLSLGRSDTIAANNMALTDIYHIPSDTFPDDVEECVLKDFVIPPLMAPSKTPLLATPPTIDTNANDDIEQVMTEEDDTVHTCTDAQYILGRRDLRNEEFICTIDPSTARDLDDALSIRRCTIHYNSDDCINNSSNNDDKDTKKMTQRRTGRGYHVGVHIADVSFFVPINTPLDDEARYRCTSTYLVEKAIPMLPRRLSEQYCSLNPGEDKFAFSALFEMDNDGHVVSEWFGQTIIRSSCRLSYEQAQEIIDGKDIDIDVHHFASNETPNEAEVDVLRHKVFKSVRLLYELASKRRMESLSRGRVALNSSRLQFTFTENEGELIPVSFTVKRQIQANWVVEEFMLLANARVAEKIVQYLPDEALLRCHPPPRANKITQLKESLRKYNITFAGSSAKGIEETIKRCQNTPHAASLVELIKYILQSARYMPNGAHDSGPRSHFALNLPWYTHFTSPIRRYSDILVHRQLLVALEIEQLLLQSGLQLPRRPDTDVYVSLNHEPFRVAEWEAAELSTRDFFYSVSEIEEITSKLNVRKEEARQASDKSIELYFCLYLRALKARALVDPNVRSAQYTSVVVLKITSGSLLLYSEEIALSVELSMKDQRQRFVLYSSEELAKLEEEQENNWAAQQRQHTTKQIPHTPFADNSAHDVNTCYNPNNNSNNTNMNNNMNTSIQYTNSFTSTFTSNNNTMFSNTNTATTTLRGTDKKALHKQADAARRRKGGKSNMPLHHSQHSLANNKWNSPSPYLTPSASPSSLSSSSTSASSSCSSSSTSSLLFAASMHDKDKQGQAKKTQSIVLAWPTSTSTPNTTNQLNMSSQMAVPTCASLHSSTTILPDEAASMLNHASFGNMEFEKVELLSELVVMLDVTQVGGRLELFMIILPPWERAAYRQQKMHIPTSLI